ncbi:hypothetical protein [Nosocomiicoccus ampullae]|uniref:hypothetical protein n=1 Tax=Nosocomiicoccus ampullae TaxID=489910 RepID=UPI00254A206B|nr:hypothetical protein [Nosocomiicoccus ampullae]MDK6863078.1 hypothetical protein [Nosocomiicoccus ampullae]
MRNYLLFSLLDLGLSKNIIATYDSLSNSLFDLIILEKREELFSQSGRKSSLNKVLGSLKNKQKWVEENYLSNHYILVGFGGSYTTIRDLYIQMKLETPVDLINLNNNEVQKIMKRDYTNRLKKIKENFNKMDNWYLDNKDFILSEFILIQLLVHKKINILTLRKLFEKNLRINNMTFKFTMKEIKEVLNKLERNSYIIFLNEYYHIADNIFLNPSIYQLRMMILMKTLN